jgi:hypothetical protein
MINILGHDNSMTVAEIKFDIHVHKSPSKITHNNITVMVTTFINFSKWHYD